MEYFLVAGLKRFSEISGTRYRKKDPVGKKSPYF